MDIQLDPSTHDLLVTNGDLSLISDDRAIRQNLKQRLQMFLGEWMLDTSKGVPYYQYILVKNPNPDLVEASFKNVILSTPGILELTKLDFKYAPGTREIEVGIQAKSASGEFSLSVSPGV